MKMSNDLKNEPNDEGTNEKKKFDALRGEREKIQNIKQIEFPSVLESFGIRKLQTKWIIIITDLI